MRNQLTTLTKIYIYHKIIIRIREHRQKTTTTGNKKSRTHQIEKGDSPICGFADSRIREFADSLSLTEKKS
jgi:hypothetical protein